MKHQTVTYWVTTGLLAFVFAFGGFGDLARIPQVLEGMNHLGYPVYFATLLGAWKALGAAAVLAPRLPLVKEWAYAGLFFDLTGAAVSHASVGDEASKVIVPLVLVALLVTSWATRPNSRRVRLETPAPKAMGHSAVSHA